MIATTTCLTGVSLRWFSACRSRNSRYLEPPTPAFADGRSDRSRSRWSEIGSGNTPSNRAMSGQRKYRELAAERRVIPQGSIAADGAQAGGGIRQAGGKADTCPATDAGQNRDVLLAAMLIGRHVADDAGRRLELVEFLAGLGVDSLEVAFERAVEHHAASRCQRTRPDRELLFHRPDDLAGLAVPGNEVAHVGLAGRWVHRQRGPDIGLARRVAHPEWLIVHAHVVGRHVEQAGVRRVGRGLLVFRAERRWADALMVHVLFLGRIFGHDLRPAVGWR